MIATIEVKPKSMILHEGVVLSKARLTFEGGGLAIYVKGRVGKRRDALNYLAMTCFLNHHIPLVWMHDRGKRK